jgi:hypothetical protein
MQTIFLELGNEKDEISIEFTEKEKQFFEKELLEAKLFRCKFHKWANQYNDFIGITIKKTGEKKLRCRHCEKDKMENKKIKLKGWENHKETASDDYVKHCLRVGKNGLKMKEIPQSLIEAKRALVKLKNLQEKLERPLKVCIRHGDLYQPDVIKSGKHPNGEQNYKCRWCMKVMHKKHYELNKAKVLAAHTDYRKRKPEKIKEMRKIYKEKNKDDELRKTKERWAKWEQKFPKAAKRRNQRFKEKSVETLNDSYIKQSLQRSTGLKSENIPITLIEAKRAVMMLKRGVKCKNEHNKLLTLEEKLDVKN